MQSFRIIQYDDIDRSSLINPLCIIGMPGIADVGKFAIDQLIGILNAKKYCEIIFNDYPAGAIVEDSILSTPKAEILYYKDPKKSRDLVLVTADAQAMSPRGIYEISDIIATIIAELGVKNVLSLGAYPIKKHDDEEMIHIFVSSTDYSLLEKFDDVPGIEKLNKGVIIGSNGLIPTLAKARFGIDGVVMLAETDKAAMLNDNFTDLEASVLLLENVGKFYHLPIKSKFSKDEMNKISKNLEDKKKQLEDELETLQPHLEITGSDKSLYI